jgi:hypothetical protein
MVGTREPQKGPSRSVQSFAVSFHFASSINPCLLSTPPIVASSRFMKVNVTCRSSWKTPISFIFLYLYTLGGLVLRETTGPTWRIVRNSARRPAHNFLRMMCRFQRAQTGCRAESVCREGQSDRPDPLNGNHCRSHLLCTRDLLYPPQPCAARKTIGNQSGCI